MAIMTSRQAAELDYAFERNGWTAEDVKKVSGGELLASLLLVVRDRAEVVVRSILTLLGTVTVPAQPAVTTSEEYFKEERVTWMRDDFKPQFLDLEVPATEETELAVRKLEKASVDTSILVELGDKAEISISQFRAFLASHCESQDWFVFYLKGRDGKLWAVRANWCVDYGWDVCASSVADPYGWCRGRRVVSRK